MPNILKGRIDTDSSYGATIKVSGTSAFSGLSTTNASIEGPGGFLGAVGAWALAQTEGEQIRLSVNKPYDDGDDVLLVAEDDAVSVLRSGVRYTFHFHDLDTAVEVLWLTSSRGGEVEPTRSRSLEIDPVGLQPGSGSPDPDNKPQRESKPQKPDQDRNELQGERTKKRPGFALPSKFGVPAFVVSIALAVVLAAGVLVWFWTSSSETVAQVNCSTVASSGQAPTFRSLRLEWFKQRDKSDGLALLTPTFDEFACASSEQLSRIQEYTQDLARRLPDNATAQKLVARYK